MNSELNKKTAAEYKHIIEMYLKNYFGNLLITIAMWYSFQRLIRNYFNSLVNPTNESLLVLASSKRVLTNDWVNSDLTFDY